MPKGNYEVEIPIFVRLTVDAEMPNKKKAYKEAWERICALFDTLPPDMHYSNLMEDEYAIVYIDGEEYDHG